MKREALLKSARRIDRIKIMLEYCDTYTSEIILDKLSNITGLTADSCRLMLYNTMDNYDLLRWIINDNINFPEQLSEIIEYIEKEKQV
jgi:hypothetical protein